MKQNSEKHSNHYAPPESNLTQPDREPSRKTLIQKTILTAIFILVGGIGLLSSFCGFIFLFAGGGLIALLSMTVSACVLYCIYVMFKKIYVRDQQQSARNTKRFFLPTIIVLLVISLIACISIFF